MGEFKFKEDRIAWLDLARVFAICCVIITHTTEGVYILNLDAFFSYSLHEGIFAFCMFTIGRLGVPIFFFLSGYLFLDRKYDTLYTAKFYKKNLLGLVVTTEIWIVLYNLFNAWFLNESINVIAVIKNLLFIQPTEMSHMWYMPVIIGIYLMIPFISNALLLFDKKILRVILSIGFVYIFLIPELNVLLEVSRDGTLQNLLDFSFLGGSYGFLLLLGYLCKQGFMKKIKTSTLFIVAITSYFITVWVQYFSYECGVGYNVWYNNASLVLTALIIFELFSRLKLKSYAWIRSLSLCSFGIYLIHNPIIMILLRYLSVENNVLKIVVVFVLSLLSSWLLVFIISKRKKISRILFFTK